MKVLIVRTDRLGDTILASPTWQALKEAHPEARVTLLTRRAFLPLFEADPLLEEVLAMPEEGRGGLDRLAADLSSRGFDALLVLYVDRAVARLVRRTASPLKAGPLSKPSSWLLFNRPLRQRRSASLLHEAEYNGRLLGALGISYLPHRPRVSPAPPGRGGEEALVRRLLGDRSRDPYLVVHPGMGGSALNWPAKRYGSLVRALLQERDETVVITGTEADAPHLGSILSQTHRRLVNTVGSLSLVELAFLLRGASVFVGPSTGPMHLATAVDTPVVTLFSPLRVQGARRWGPYCARGTVLTPPVDCRQTRRCRGHRCADRDCMDRIAVGDVLSAVACWLDAKPERSQNSL